MGVWCNAVGADFTVTFRAEVLCRVAGVPDPFPVRSTRMSFRSKEKR